MASVTTTALTELGGKFVLNRTALGNISNSSDQQNVLSGSGTIFLIEIDNEANSSAVYLKIVDGTSCVPSNSSANSTGTPDMSFIAPGFSKVCYSFPQGIALSTGLSYWLTTGTALGTDSNASSAVIIKILCG
tara:strand:+ start:3310 stop:3708 length:399 start_codon:yes stop_codon:yes gene_type:complete